MNKPIIPWNAVEFFSNPGKYEVITAGGNVSREPPIMDLRGDVKYPYNWQGMRDKTVIVKRTKYVRMYRNGQREVYAGSCFFDTPEGAKKRISSTFVAVGTLTWEEEQ